MTYSLRDDQVSLALDCIVKDVDKNYDECLVEQFLEYIGHESRNLRDFSHDTEFVVKRLKSYLDHENLLALNQSRILKIVYALIRRRKIDDEVFQNILPILDRLWEELCSLLKIPNLAAITVWFNILNVVTKVDIGYDWITNGKFCPAIQTNHGDIKDIFDLVRHYICHCNNYHTKNSAENFFISLVTSEAGLRCDDNRKISVIRKSIDELIFRTNQNQLPIYLKMLQLVSDSPQSLETLKEKFSPEKFSEVSWVIDSTHIKGKALKDYCRCLAYYKDESPNELVIKELIKRDLLEETIIYSSQCSIRENCLDPRFLSFVLSPLIKEDPSLKTDSISQDLNGLERKFHKLTTLSGLVQLSSVLDHCEISADDKSLILEVISKFVQEETYTPEKYKILMECCSILGKLIKDDKEDKIYHQVADKAIDILDYLHASSESVIFDSGDTKKPITFALLKLLRNRTIDRSKVMELASRFADEDIIEELTELLSSKTLSDFTEDHQVGHELETPESINTAMHCSVDDILNYELISDGIQDCY